MCQKHAPYQLGHAPIAFVIIPKNAAYLNKKCPHPPCMKVWTYCLGLGRLHQINMNIRIISRCPDLFTLCILGLSCHPACLANDASYCRNIMQMHAVRDESHDRLLRHTKPTKARSEEH